MTTKVCKKCQTEKEVNAFHAIESNRERDTPTTQITSRDMQKRTGMKTLK
jgi:hypothetical protein